LNTSSAQSNKDHRGGFALDFAEPRVIGHREHGLSPQQVSSGARKVVHALCEAGFSAELVGGCVRDLLLEHVPKDFDVVTDARPEEVRQVFRRARLIGRRFRLAHVRMGREVVEVSTYRSLPTMAGGDYEVHGEHGRILRDNVFGNRDQDAMRRDFTVNALYYDPLKNEVIDYVDGFKDLQAGRLRMIGLAAERISEDPVRMLRAVRFQAKLGLVLDQEIEVLMPEMAYFLRHVPPARLFDEVLKMFHHGHALKVFDDLYRYGLFAELFPAAARAFIELDLESRTGLVRRVLINTDQRVKEGKPVIAAFLFAGLLWRALLVERDRRVSHGTAGYPALQQAAGDVIGRESQRIAIPRRVSIVMLEIWEMQHRLQERRPRMIQRLLENKRFRAAYDFLVLRAGAGEVAQDIADWWTRVQAVTLDERRQMINALAITGDGRKRRPRKRRRRPVKTATP
jgi:poly(A) polymerase